MKISKQLILKGLAMGAIAFGLTLGSAACGSDGTATEGTGNGFGDAMLSSSQASEAETTLLSYVDASEINTASDVSAAADYAASVGSCADAAGNVVTIDFPCSSIPNIDSGTLTVTFTNSSIDTVAIATTETLVATNGAEIELTTTASLLSTAPDTWDIVSTSTVSFIDSSSTTTGDYQVVVGDPCSTLNGSIEIEMDIPELDASPVEVPFTGTYEDFETCNDGGCPDGTMTLGIEGVYELTLEFDAANAEATITIDAAGAAAAGTDPITVPLECDAR